MNYILTRTVDDPITLYTCVLAVFTIILAVASIWQGRLTSQSIKLAQQEFIASHRPKLRVRLLTLKPPDIGKPLEFGFTISNLGDSSAKDVSYSLYFRMPSINRSPSIRWEGDGKSRILEIPAGGQAVITHTADFVCPPNHFADYLEGRLLVGGLITYEDGNSVVRMTSFRRIAAEGRKGTFRQCDPINPDFEFEG